MQTIELHQGSIAAAARLIPENTPLVMVNLVRYKERAAYPKNAGIAPCSGREAYMQHYAPSFAQVAAQLGLANTFRPIFVGSARALLAGPEEERWQDVVLVEYDSFEVFRAIVESPEYRRDADPHRNAALMDWRLIATEKQPLG